MTASHRPVAAEVGGARVTSYFELPFTREPTHRPGYWNSALLSPRPLPSDWGPNCPINFCQVHQKHGLLLSPHVGWWLVNTAAGQIRWYCTDHLPRKYLQAIHERWIDAAD